MRTKLIVFFLLILFFTAHAQNLEGLSGLFFIPTAELQNDGTVSLGVNYLDKELVSFSGFKDNAFTPFVTLTYLPFAEFSFRITRLIKTEITTQGIGDRTISARIRIIEEEKYLPSVLIGFHDLLAVFGGESAIHNNALYLTASKHIKFDSSINFIGLHIGYGTDAVKANTHNFAGLFGGINFKIFDMLELIGEYDSERFNGAVRLSLFRHISLLGGLMDFKNFSGGAAFNFVL